MISTNRDINKYKCINRYKFINRYILIIDIE